MEEDQLNEPDINDQENLHFKKYPPDLITWIGQARSVHQKHLESLVKVVGIITKDSPERSKAEDVNNFLKADIFPLWVDESDVMKITVHFSPFDNTLFLLVNGTDDTSNLLTVFGSNSPEIRTKSFFEKLQESDDQQCRMLYFLCITCQFLLILEPASRLDLSLFRNLRKVNNLRFSTRARVQEALKSTGVEFLPKNAHVNEKEGRLAIPRLLIGFHRNNVRSDLSNLRRREVYEKLEESLDRQLAKLLKTYNLIECGGKSLCQLNEKLPVVNVINPGVVRRDVLAEVLEYFISEKKTKPKKVMSTSFNRFLEANLKALSNSHVLPTLEKVVTAFDALKFILDPNEFVFDAAFANHELHFADILAKEQVRDAVAIYENRSRARPDEFGKGSVNEKARSKVEHDQRFSQALTFLNSVLTGDGEKAVGRLREQCDQMWEGGLRGCDQRSLTGNPCALRAHPCIGDATTSEDKWQLHKTNVTHLSTCACGSTQALRADPFTVKEANCDFYELPMFICCKRLERLPFNVFHGDDDDDKEEWETENWVGPKSNSLVDQRVKDDVDEIQKTLKQQKLDELDDDDDDDDDAEDSDESDKLSEGADDRSTTPSSAEDAAKPRDMRSYLNNDSSDEERDLRDAEKATSSEPTKNARTSAIDHVNRVQKLKNSSKKDMFIEGVPNTLTAGRLPLFSSWILSCLGPSRIYNHATGLRRQPNFKIGGEFLTPVVVHLQVDMNLWQRDLDALQMYDDVGNEVIKAKYIKRRHNTEEIARVKLFVGFEYQCSRGHRFFVDEEGEPLVHRGNMLRDRDAENRRCNTEVLLADLPLRRQCTCKKLPIQAAQLTKVHVVTPKAPVVVTIQPTVEVPGHQGQYITGQVPMKLERAKYYVLQAPFVYSGPSDVCMPDKLEKQGIWKGNAIQVAFKPTTFALW